MDDIIETPPSPYWMLHFIVKHGDWVAIVCGLLPLLASIAAIAALGVPAWALVVGVVGSAFLYLLMRAFVELVRVIVDMLLPK
jgi:hypothetical protein